MLKNKGKVGIKSMETKASTRIRRLRNESGLSMKEFADHVGIPLRTIEDWEAGKRNPPAYVLNLIEFWVKHEIKNE